LPAGYTTALEVRQFAARHAPRGWRPAILSKRCPASQRGQPIRFEAAPIEGRLELPRSRPRVLLRVPPPWPGWGLWREWWCRRGCHLGFGARGEFGTRADEVL